MKLVGIIDEDFVNYRKPAMVLEFPYCDFKCMKECGMQICQNLPLASLPIIEVSPSTLIQRYINNPITEAIVMQGLEPLSPQSIDDVIKFIFELRYQVHNSVDIVIYTGYENDEIIDTIKRLKCAFNNQYSANNGKLIIKFGRFKPNEQYHYDEVLGVNLASSNQYGEIIIDNN